MSKKSLVLILFLIVFSNIFSVQIKQSLENKGNILIGTPINFKVELVSNLNDSIKYTFEDTSEVFELLNTKKNKKSLENKLYTDYSFTFASFETGKQILPELNFKVFNLKDSTIVSTKPEPININAITADSTKQIADIHGLNQVKLSLWNIIFPIVSAIVLLLLIIFLIKYLVNKDTKVEAIKETDTRSPYEKTMELIQALENSDFLLNGKLVLFNFRLSHILRFFIEEQYKINSLEMTTFEIKNKLKLDYDEKHKVINFLNETDKIKFAKGQTSKKESRERLNWLKDYIKNFQYDTKENEEELNNA